MIRGFFFFSFVVTRWLSGEDCIWTHHFNDVTPAACFSFVVLYWCDCMEGIKVFYPSWSSIVTYFHPLILHGRESNAWQPRYCSRVKRALLMCHFYF